MTAQEIITSAFRLIGKITGAQTPSSDDSDIALWILNQMLDAWSTERLIVYHIARDTETLTADQAAYTYGTGGDFNATRPIRIERAGIVLTDQTKPTEYPIALIRYNSWAEVTVKTTEATIPSAVYTDDAYPLITLTFWPVPTTAYDVALYVWRALSSFAATSTTVSVPPAYVDALRYNLAVRMAPEWRFVPRPDVIAFARESLAKVQRINMPIVEMGLDAALINRDTGQTFFETGREGPFSDEFGGPFA